MCEVTFLLGASVMKPIKIIQMLVINLFFISVCRLIGKELFVMMER